MTLLVPLWLLMVAKQATVAMVAKQAQDYKAGTSTRWVGGTKLLSSSASIQGAR
jgi:hypothetical protein